MGPGELAVVIAVVVAVAAATWASRDARRRGVPPLAASAIAALVLVTFPLGPAVYARLRHQLAG